MANPFNLNVNPYFEDFDALDDYYQILFRPGRPIQARELNNVQAGLQNQINSLASANYKEGQVVVPGSTSYNRYYDCIQLNNAFFGISVSNYINQLLNQEIVGSSSGVTAKVLFVLSPSESINKNTTLYIQYLAASPSDFSNTKFVDGETIQLTTSSVTYGNTTIPPLTPLASLISSQAIQVGSSFHVNDGIYFVRNYLVRCSRQSILLDQYSTEPSYRIGFSIQERIVTSIDDETLTDNAQGFNNYAAPGADRLQINLILTKKPLDDYNDINFVELARVINGVLQIIEVTTEVPWRAELARRTYDESGNYYVRQFQVAVKESENDLIGNNGIYLPGQQTSSGLTPSDDLIVYTISPGKAYVQGYEVETTQTTYIDAPKPRTTESVEEITVPFQYDNSFSVNNISGTPPIGNVNAFIEIYSERIGSAGLTTVGLAKVYDFAYTNGYQSSSSIATIDFYDVQLFTTLSLSSFPSIPTQTAFITGANSGASGYLYSSNSSTKELVLYQTTGSFVVGEAIIINGVSQGASSNIIITRINNYNSTRAKSVGFDGGATGRFEADLVLDVPFIPLSLSTQYTIVPGAGVATLSAVGNDFAASIFVGDIVSYSKQGGSTTTYNVVTAINALGNQLTLQAVPSVAGVCDGTLPTSTITVNDLVVVRSSLTADYPNLWALLPKSNVVSVATTSSIVYERYQVSGNVTSNSLTISAPTGKTFQPFNTLDYSLSYSNGFVEPLTSQKVSVSPTGTTIFFTGLSVANATDVLVNTVLVNSSVSSKVKTLNRSSTLVIDGSNVDDESSTAKGLTYRPSYGTRVQDATISLNVCDVLDVKGIFESNDSNDPFLPSIQVASINPSVTKIIVGEKFRGETSLTVATVVSTDPVNQLVSFVLDNNNSFKVGEIISFYESSVIATVNATFDGSKNVSDNYTFNNGQSPTILDYSRLILNSNSQPAKGKLLVVYDYYTLNPNDSGTFVTQSSYSAYNYGSQIPFISVANISDIIDLRPRVSPFVYNVLNPRSPFEFLARTYTQGGNSASNVIIAGESIVVGLTYYLPRIDNIFVDSSGSFQLRLGTPSENPQPPLNVNDAINLATVNLPAYLTNAKYCTVTTSEYKRYQMKDISKLETRISNLEYYTNLSLLESTTLSVTAKDPATGLDRFKSGFFVDNFRTHNVQDITNVEFRAASDPINGYLRPSHYTTSIDLLLGSYSVLGIGTIPANQVDLSTNLTDLIGSNVQKTGDLITLSYTETIFAQQNFATRVENVTPFLVVDYLGNVTLTPNSDTWIDTTSLEANNIQLEGDYQSLLNQFGANAQTGLAPIDWGAWETNWIGVNVDGNQTTNVTQSQQRTRVANGTLVTDTTTTRTNTNIQVGVDLGQTRTGTQTQITPRIETADLGSRIVSRDLIPFMRSRNLQFVAKSMKPSTQHYVFFDNIDMNAYVVPKLLEIQMQENSPPFVKGETVIGIVPSSFASSSANQEIPYISFRLAQSNHKYGNYLTPTEIYTTNPYSPSITGTPNIISVDYSTTSTTLNVDTESLQTQSLGQFFGYVVPGMTVIGQTSQASAIITNVRIISDTAGTIIGSLFFPEPNQIGTPTFLSGLRTFRLSSSRSNSPIPGDVSSSGTAVFYSQGQIDTTQETSLSIRFGDVSVTRGISESRIISGSDSASFTSGTSTSTNLFISDPPPPPPRVDPLAETFYVDEQTPIYVTSIDAFFYTKDPGNIPVIMELRTTSNGYPTDTILPFGTVVLTPDQVNVSDDGTVPTKFTFPSPVILNGNGALYAVVLKSVSQSYNAWCARMGEIDITTVDKPDSQKIIVGNQPATGDLFKSGNGSTWVADGYEDLKFVIYKAQFDPNPGSINFYNPQLNEGNKQTIVLKKNPFEMLSKNLILNFGSNISNIFGYTLYQTNPGTGTTSQGIVQEQSGTISQVLINSGGVGYSTGNYTGIGITALTGTGQGGTANLTVGVGGTITAFTITNGGIGYSINDTISIINDSNLQFGTGFIGIVSTLSTQNTLTLIDVSAQFDNINDVFYLNPSTGLSVNLGVPISVVNGINDGLHMKVTHGNHAMNDIRNYVTITDATTEIPPVDLTVGIATFTSSISVSNSTEFSIFEGLPVSASNPGYVTIDQEIIGYTDVGTNVLQGTITRGVDGTIPVPHNSGTKVYKYEMNNISLRRINTSFQIDDAIESDQYYPQLDYYFVKINTNSNGTNRNNLFIGTNGSFGGENVTATQNIQFSTITPNIQVLTPTGTRLSTRIRTISGTSVGSNTLNLQPSFIDQGYIDVTNQSANNLASPALIASQINENIFTTDLIGKKSFNLEMGLFTTNLNISPCIDLTRLGCILTSNRLDNQILEFDMDPRVNSLSDDPSAAIYISKPINLKNPATALQVLVACNRPATSDFRVLYRIFTNDSQNQDQKYQLFPGYLNLDNQGRVINPRNNSGLPDAKVASSTQDLFLDYQFTATDLPSFTGFAIKIVMVGTNQAAPPILRDLRAIALA